MRSTSLAVLVAVGLLAVSAATALPGPSALLCTPLDHCEDWSAEVDGRAPGPGVLAIAPDGSLTFLAVEADGPSVVRAHRADDGVQVWQTVLDLYRVRALQVTPDGSALIVAGASSTFQPVSARLGAAQGEVQWLRAYPYNATSTVMPQGLALDAHRAYVTGFLRAGSVRSDDVLTWAIDATNGDLLWTERFGSAHDLTDFPSDIALAPDGRLVVVTGSSRVAAEETDQLILAYGDDGTLRWSRFHDAGDGHDGGARVRVDGQGRVITTGNSVVEGRYGFETLALDAADGALRWRAHLPTGAYVADLATSPDGAVAYVTGTARHPQGYHMATVAYEVGNPRAQWEQRFAYPDVGYDFSSGLRVGASSAAALALSADGQQLFITGTSGGHPWLGHGMLTLALDAASGEPAWASRFETQGTNVHGQAVQTMQTGGSVVAAGVTSDGRSFLLAYPLGR